MPINIPELQNALKTKQIKDATFERLGLTLLFEDGSQLVVKVTSPLSSFHLSNVDLNVKLTHTAIEKNL